jgi:hypothetical protein
LTFLASGVHDLLALGIRVGDKVLQKNNNRTPTLTAV